MLYRLPIWGQNPLPLSLGVHVIDTLVDAFSGAGAPFMYAITAALAFGLAILLERMWIFWGQWRINQSAFLTALSNGELQEAGQMNPFHPACRVVRAGLGAQKRRCSVECDGNRSPSG